MFFFTAKFSRKKALIIVLVLAAILCAVILLAGWRDQAASADAEISGIRDEADVVEYLGTLGWEVSPEPLEVQEVLIPRQFSEVYESYNELQKDCGWDLSQYGGIDAVRYTYQILNYPDGGEDIVADVLVADGNVIGGDIQSVQLDGFMHGLTKNAEAA